MIKMVIPEKDYQHLKCVACKKFYSEGLSIEMMDHIYEHVEHCNWYDYTGWCPHNLGNKIKRKQKVYNT